MGSRRLPVWSAAPSSPPGLLPVSEFFPPVPGFCRGAIVPPDFPQPGHLSWVQQPNSFEPLSDRWLGPLLPPRVKAVRFGAVNLGLLLPQDCPRPSRRASGRQVAGGCATKSSALPRPGEKQPAGKRSNAEPLILQVWKRHSRGSSQGLSLSCGFERVFLISHSPLRPVAPGSAQPGQSGDWH